MYEHSHELDYSDDEVLQAGALMAAVVLTGVAAKRTAEQKGTSEPRAIMIGIAAAATTFMVIRAFIKPSEATEPYQPNVIH